MRVVKEMRIIINHNDKKEGEGLDSFSLVVGQWTVASVLFGYILMNMAAVLETIYYYNKKRA